MTTHNTTGAHQTPEPAQPAETTMTAQTPAQADAHGAESEAWLPQFTRREVVFTMAGVLLIMLLASLDQTIVATALPRIIGELHGFDRYAWVATAYLLTETITVPIYGKLSDLWGRKPIFLFGLVVFLTGSALSGAAPTMNALIAFRALQGLGSGALLPIATAVTGDLFSPRERGKWQGITGSVFALSSILGPLLGGWITDHATWRLIFYVNMPVGIVALLVLIFVMPTIRGSRQARVDVIGALLLAAGTTPLLLGFTWAGSRYDWLSPQILGLFAGALALLAALIVYEARLERRGQEPIIAPSLFTGSMRIFGVSALVSAIAGLGIFGASFYIPLFVQGVIGATVTNSGLILTPLIITAMVGSVTGGMLITLTGRYKFVALAGLLISIAGALLLVRLDVHSSNADVVWAMLVLGVGIGSGISVYTVIVQNALPGRIGQATSALVFFRQIGGTIGLAAMGSVLSAAYLPAFNAALPPALREQASGRLVAAFASPQTLLSPGALAQMRAAAAAYGPQGLAALDAILYAVKQGLATSLHQVFLVALGVFIVGFCCALALKEIPLRERKKAPATP
jgi:EmrB/QacA subfamily drug resistance transporter